MSYRSVHIALKETIGPASAFKCACGNNASDWAYQHTGVRLTDERGRYFSDNVLDYAPMCRSCHTTLDRIHDPEWAQAVAVHASVLGKRAKSFKQCSAAGKKGIVVAQQTEELQAHYRRLNEIAFTVKRRCSCGFESGSSGVGRHQQASGHVGWISI